jgi:hypothetical protein
MNLFFLGAIFASCRLPGDDLFLSLAGGLSLAQLVALRVVSGPAEHRRGQKMQLFSLSVVTTAVLRASPADPAQLRPNNSRTF